MKDIQAATRRPKELAKQDRLDYFRHRGVIKRGKETFAAVADSLIQIRDRELWRAEYHSWDHFVGGELDFSRRHANRIIAAGRVMAALPSPDSTPKPAPSRRETNEVGPNVPPVFPANESQARELSRLDDDSAARAEVFSAAVSIAGGKQPTAEQIKEVVDAHLGDTPLDGLGEPITRESLKPAFRARAKLVEATRLISRAKQIIKAVWAAQDGAAKLEIANATAKLGYVQGGINEAMPFVPCGDCEGICAAQCERCCSRGWLTKPEIRLAELNERGAP